MTKYTFNLLVFLCGAILPIIGQQTPTYTEYNYNPFIINSAYAGVLDGAEATLSNIGFGNQNFEGAPRSLAVSFNTPLRNEAMGLGAGVISDQIGVTSATQVFAAYSYKIFLNNNAHPYWKVYDRSFVSFGLNAGALVYKQDLLSLGINDDANFSENVNATLPSIGAGVLFGHGNFFAGFSIPNLVGDAFANQDNLVLSRPVYGYSGYHFITNKFDPKFILKPSVLIKYEKGAPFQMDFNMGLSYKNNFEVGVGYRTSSTLNLVAGFYVFKNIRALYSYTQGSSDSPLATTHGIVLSYRAGNGYAF